MYVRTCVLVDPPYVCEEGPSRVMVCCTTYYVCLVKLRPFKSQGLLAKLIRGHSRAKACLQSSFEAIQEPRLACKADSRPFKSQGLLVKLS